MKRTKKKPTKPIVEDTAPPVVAIPQIRVRFVGDRLVADPIYEAVALHDIMVSLSMPVARKLVRQLQRALREARADTETGGEGR